MSDGYEHILAFREAMAEKGITFKGELVADGVLHRVDVDGDKPHTKNGWYLLHLDGRPNGEFGCWKRYQEEKLKWSAAAGTKRMSAEERAAMAARIEEDKRRRADEQAAIWAAAAARAKRAWEKMGPASPNHAYCKRKQIEPHGARVGDWVVESPPDPETGEIRETVIKGALVVPMTFKREIHSLQAIFANDRNALRRGKDFLAEGRKVGLYHSIGGRPKDPDQEFVITFCEGYATGCSIHDATGRLVIVCFDCGNLDPVVKFFREQYPDVRFVIAADNDQWTTKPVANPGVTKARAAAEAYNCLLAVPQFPKLDGKPTDFNDLHVLHGIHLVRQQIEDVIAGRASFQFPAEPEPQPELDPAPPAKPEFTPPDPVKPTGDVAPYFGQPVGGLFIPPMNLSLLVGSDVEIAQSLVSAMRHSFGDVVYTEGEFWRFDLTHWKTIAANTLRLAVHQFDSATVVGTRGGSGGAALKLGRSRIDSVLNEAAAIITDDHFFEHAHPGINCASGFVEFDVSGEPVLIPHSPEHRCRHVLPGCWSPDSPTSPPADSLLCRLLDGVFKDDEDAADKHLVLAEIAGATAFGYGTRLSKPKAIIFKGATAENGKSQVLDLYRGLVPASAVSSISPGSFGNPTSIIRLAGKLLNARDELSSASAIASEAFKLAVTGEPLQGRDLYKPEIDFRPIAQHVYATNELPSFTGGMDRGVRRRLLVVEFNRSIPEDEKIDMIGRRATSEEPDILLGWAVGGAKRLVQQRNFTMPSSSKAALREWLCSADPVQAWASVSLRVAPPGDHPPRLRTSVALRHFKGWALSEGYREQTLPAVNGFPQRVMALMANEKGVRKVRTAQGPYFEGIEIIGGAEYSYGDAPMTHESRPF